MESRVQGLEQRQEKMERRMSAVERNLLLQLLLSASLVFLFRRYSSTSRADDEVQLDVQINEVRNAPSIRPTEGLSDTAENRLVKLQFLSSQESGLEKESTKTTRVRNGLCEFIGRSRELDEAVGGIEGGNDDIINVYGGSGIGKRRTFVTELVNRIRSISNESAHCTYYCALKPQSAMALNDVLTMLVNPPCCSNTLQELQEDPKASLLDWCKQLSKHNEKALIILDDVDEVLMKDPVEFLSVVSDINSEETRQNLTKTEEIVEACGRVPGYLCDAARLLNLIPRITEDDLIERFRKRWEASRMLNNNFFRGNMPSKVRVLSRFFGN